MTSTTTSRRDLPRATARRRPSHLASTASANHSPKETPREYHAKAASTGSTPRQASRLGRFFRGGLATRASSPTSIGSGAPPGRLRLTVLLAALTAIFVLAPAALASATDYPIKVELLGSGHGKVKIEAATLKGGNIHCSNIPGEVEEVPAECKSVGETSLVTNLVMTATPAAGDEITAWTQIGIGTPAPTCASQLPSTTTVSCQGLATLTASERVLKVTFTAPGFPLTLTTSGSGTGSFECEDITAAGAAAPCASGVEFPENDEVKVIAKPDTGSHFEEFNSENSGECSGATCTVIMSTGRTVNAKNDLDAETFSESVTGDGELKCEDATEGGGFTACASTYPYGHTVKVEAIAHTGSHLETLTGSGSAACAGAECSFVIHEASGASAAFALDAETFSESVTGDGELKCEDATEGGGFTACASTYPYGHTVKVEAIAHTGSHLETLTGSGSAACAGAECSFVIHEASGASAAFALDAETFSESVTGDGELKCEDATEGGGFTACASTYPYGHTVKVEAIAHTGSHLETLTGSGSAACAGAECSFVIHEASGASATFALDEEPLTINETGSPGTGEVKCNGGSCAGPWHYGDMIEITATPTGGSSLGTISGSGSASSCTNSPCAAFEITAASTYNVEWVPSGAASLTVAKSGAGKGTVESTVPASPTLVCDPECTAEGAVFTEGQMVRLKETPQLPGSIFVSWSSNCAPISATECEVEVQAGGTAVTATFIPVAVVTPISAGGACGEATGVKVEYAGASYNICSGEAGSPGADGGTPTITPFTKAEEEGGTPPGHPCNDNGGTKIVLGATTSYVCNGAQGAQGDPGGTPTITVTAFGPGEHGCPAGVSGSDVDFQLGATHTHAYICNGANGSDGSDGQSVTVTVEPPGVNCANGGFKLESVSGTSYVCNGTNGTDGANGQNGAPGADGQNGAAGAQGPAGPQGATGPQGKTGKVKVTCKVKGSKKIKCTVKQPKASSSAVRLRWNLHRDGSVVSHGRTSAKRLQHLLNHLRPGRYVLHVAGQHGVVIKVS